MVDLRRDVDASYQQQNDVLLLQFVSLTTLSFPSLFVILLTNTAYEPVIQVLSEIAHSVTSPFAEDIDYPYAILHHWRFKLDTDLLSIIRRTTNARIYQPAEMTHSSRTKPSWRVNKLLVERLKEYSASVLMNIPCSSLSILILSTSAVVLLSTPVIVEFRSRLSH